jgi:lactate dehydrogenase-like 2-hydroxyacid dehydrogenase
LGLDEPWAGSTVGLVDGQDLPMLWSHVATRSYNHPRLVRPTLHADHIVIAQDRKMADALLSVKDNSDTLPYSRPATPDHGHRVGVYGLGAIGYHVARNLANSHSGLPIVVYNRTSAKSEKLANELGPNKISIAQNPAELVNSCDIMYAVLTSNPTHALTYWHQLHNSRER